MKLRLTTVALSISMLFMMACGGETDKRAFADSDYDYCVSNWQEDVVKEVDYADLQASYQPNQWYSMLVDLAGRSYPDMGATFVKAMSEKKWINLGWVEPGQTDTFESGVLEQVNTAVHEAP